MTHLSLPVSPDYPASPLGFDELGWIEVPSAKILVGDPFQGLQRRGNSFITVEPGRYRVIRTRRTNPDGSTETLALSLVLSEELLSRRQRWQRERLAMDGDDTLPASAITEAGTEEASGEERGLLMPSPSGCIGIVDAVAFENGMPPDREDEGESWYDVLFEHGTEHSWFDQLDRGGESDAGAALISLPYGYPGEFIAIAQSKPGLKRVWFERAFHLPGNAYEAQEDDDLLIEIITREHPLIALHIDMSEDGPQGV